MNVRVGKGSAPAPVVSPGQPAGAPAQPGEKSPERKARDDPEYAAEREKQCANARSIVEDGSHQRYSQAKREKMIGDARAFQAEHCN